MGKSKTKTLLTKLINLTLVFVIILSIFGAPMNAMAEDLKVEEEFTKF